MTYTLTEPFTFDDFITQYSDSYCYELADGEIIDRELTGPHEAAGSKLAAKTGAAIETAKLSWFLPRTCLVEPFGDVTTLVALTNYYRTIHQAGCRSGEY